MKKAISLIILAAMLASFASCGQEGGKNNPTDGTTAGENGETTEALTGREAVLDNLPDKKFDKNFTILTRTKYDYEFNTPEADGDVLNDALYNRDRKVEERFGVTFKTVAMDCNWPSTEFNNNLRASIMSGDGVYDLVAGYAATIPGLVGEGLFIDWNTMKYNDFTKPWWSDQIADEMNINGKCYLVTGDASLVLWQNMRCMLFNKRLAENYKTPDLYEIVKNGEWTFDKLVEITKDVYTDLDGDGKMSDGDLYGYITDYATAVDNLKEAFEIKVTTKGSDGVPKLTFMSTKAIEAIGKLNSFFYDSGAVNFTAEFGNKSGEHFSNGQGLIGTSILGKVDKLRAMDDDFGIIPYPKYDSKQENYHSTSLDEFTLFVIPKDAKNPEMTSIVLEGIASESYKKVVPAFYDVALKTKGARDDESAEMIDMIRDGLTFDFGYLNSSALDGVGHLWVNLLRNNNNNVASEYAKKEASYEENLEKLLEVYR